MKSLFIFIGRMKNTNEKFIGKTFGNLLVLTFERRNERGQTFWKCKCKCGKEKIIRGDHLLDAKTKSCGCNNQGARHHRWKGCGEIGGWTWNNYKLGASRRKIPFQITVKEMWDVFEKQNRKCALTGEELILPLIQKNDISSNASLDRIDNTKGYTVNNIQWVTKKINFMKGKLSQSNFIKLCHMVSQKNPL